MAQIAIAAGGAGLGFAFGGPFGARLGWTAGLILGGLLFPTVEKGPRLADLKVGGQGPGQPIPRAWGTVRLPGTVIWQHPVLETRSRTSGGKGLGGPKVKTFTYYWTGACLFADTALVGAATRLLKLWANGRLIYDVTGTGTAVRAPGVAFSVHLGATPGQVDPIVAAALGADALAWSGRAVIVFDALPVADYGNRPPNITALWAFAAAASHPAVIFGAPPTLAVNAGEMAVDWDRGAAWTVDGAGAATTKGLVRYDLATGDVLNEALAADIGLLGPSINEPIAAGPDGFVYAVEGSAAVAKIDGVGLRAVASTGAHGWNDCAAMGFVVLDDPLAGRVTRFIGRFGFDGMRLFQPDMSQLWPVPFDFAALDEARALAIVTEEIGIGYGTALVIGGPADGVAGDLGIYRLRCESWAAYDADAGVVYGVSFDKIDTVDKAAWGGAVGPCEGFLRDPEDGGLVFTAPGSGDRLHKWVAGEGLVWSVPAEIAGHNHRPGHWSGRIADHRYGWMRGGGLAVHDTRDGAPILTDASAAANFGVTEAGAVQWDGVSGALVCARDLGTGRPFRILTERYAAAAFSLATIVTDLCRDAGFVDAEIDAAALAATTVRGYALTRPGATAEALGQLGRAFAFGWRADGAGIAFYRLDTAAVATLTQTDLLPRSEGGADWWTETRAPDAELPARVTIAVMDVDADWQDGTASWRRVLAPVPAMWGRGEDLAQWPLAMTLAEAKAAAMRLVAAIWAERRGATARLDWSRLALEPGDAVSVTLDDGAALTGRIARLDLGGAGFELDLTLAETDPELYDQAADAQAQDGVTLQVVPAAAPAELFVIDAALLRDTDDVGQTAAVVYLAAAGLIADGWPGAAIESSADASWWVEKFQLTTAPSWGVALDALPDTAAPYAPDRTTVLRVAVAAGADRLESVTDSALWNGANAALVGAEVIQFRDAVEAADGVWDLSWLIRGRRLTEPETGGHAAGERFLLLDPDWVRRDVVPVAQLGGTLYWRATSFGLLPEAAAVTARALDGRSLWPGAPSYLRRADDTPGAGDITVSFRRRTRLGGASWLVSTDPPPLGEAAESYQLDVLDGPGGAVLRTLASADEAAGFVYDAADVGTDWGSPAPPATLYVRAYQIGATGRGWSAEWALDDGGPLRDTP